jgi:hypothetical protein
MPSFAQLFFVGLCCKVLRNEFTSRDASDRDRSFDNGKDDLKDVRLWRVLRQNTHLANCTVNGKCNSSFEDMIDIEG